MSKMVVELDHDGMRDLLRSQEMLDICEDFANKTQRQLGEGFLVTGYTGPGRVNASIKAESGEARRKAFNDNAIEKAVWSSKE